MFGLGRQLESIKWLINLSFITYENILNNTQLNLSIFDDNIEDLKKEINKINISCMGAIAHVSTVNQVQLVLIKDVKYINNITKTMNKLTNLDITFRSMTIIKNILEKRLNKKELLEIIGLDSLKLCCISIYNASEKCKLGELDEDLHDITIDIENFAFEDR